MCGSSRTFLSITTAIRPFRPSPQPQGGSRRRPLARIASLKRDSPFAAVCPVSLVPPPPALRDALRASPSLSPHSHPAPPIPAAITGQARFAPRAPACPHRSGLSGLRGPAPLHHSSRRAVVVLGSGSNRAYEVGACRHPFTFAVASGSRRQGEALLAVGTRITLASSGHTRRGTAAEGRQVKGMPATAQSFSCSAFSLRRVGRVSPRPSAGVAAFAPQHGQSLGRHMSSGVRWPRFTLRPLVEAPAVLALSPRCSRRLWASLRFAVSGATLESR